MWAGGVGLIYRLHIKSQTKVGSLAPNKSRGCSWVSVVPGSWVLRVPRGTCVSISVSVTRSQASGVETSRERGRCLREDKLLDVQPSFSAHVFIGSPIGRAR